jgi:P-type E1-E2 ATPase
MLVGIIWAGISLWAGHELYLFVTGSESKPEPEPEPKNEPENQPDNALEKASTTSIEASPDDESSLDQLGNSLGLSFAALGLSLIGGIFPWAKWLSYPLLALSIAPVARDSWEKYRETGRVNFMGLTALGASIELALGYNTLAAFGWILFTGGHELQARTRRQAAADLQLAFDKHPEHAWLLCDDGAEVQIRVKDITVHHRLIVRTGEPIPIDGRIIEGVIAVDQRALTGESRLQELGVGDEVLAATLVLSGTAVIAPVRTGSATVAARVEAMLAETESFEQALRARAEVEADRSVRPTWGMMGVGLIKHGYPGVLAGFWTNCSDLTWFGAPYSVVNSVQAAARAEILIKDGRSLELLSQVDTVVFDKTGTLTLDSFGVVQIYSFGSDLGIGSDDVLSIAAALERRQLHPIAQAIVEAADQAGLPVREPEQLRSTIGYGMSALIDGRVAVLGSLRYMATESIALPDEVAPISEAAATSGNSLVYLGIDGRCAGLIELAPKQRPEAAEILDKLRARGLEIMMVTGDEEGPSAAVARQLGISNYYARALPEDKDRIIAELQAAGRIVCFVGDGLNDSLALKRANVSISMTGASFLAIETAQILLQSGSLEHLVLVFELADHFEADQDRIVGTSRFLTVASSIALTFMGLTLPAVVWMYTLGFGFTLWTASLPLLRSTESKPRELDRAS